MFGLYTSSSCWGVVEESQENTEIMTRHETHGRFLLLHKGDTGGTQLQKQRTKNYCSWSPSYIALNSGGKMKICEKHQTF